MGDQSLDNVFPDGEPNPYAAPLSLPVESLPDASGIMRSMGYFGLLYVAYGAIYTGTRVVQFLRSGESPDLRVLVVLVLTGFYFCLFLRLILAAKAVNKNVRSVSAGGSNLLSASDAESQPRVSAKHFGKLYVEGEKTLAAARRYCILAGALMFPILTVPAFIAVRRLNRLRNKLRADAEAAD